jgi:topoisomerase-4 subunit A
LKKDEFIADCSELDDVIVIRRDGKAKVSRINEKVFMGKDILHVGIWRKGDERMIYNLIYSDGKSGGTFAKRFAMPAITRDKEYDLDQGNPNSKVHYLSANPNGEAEVVEVKLSQSSTARKKIFDFDFSELESKGRGARGNTITKYPVRKVDFKEGRGSTLSGLKLWFDQASGRLNKDERGKYVNKFDGEDKIIAITSSGNYKITSFETTNRYEPEKTILVEKFNPKKVISAIYWDGESKQHFVKRFLIETTTPDKEFGFISEGIGSRLEFVTTAETPEVEIEMVKGKGKEKESEVVNLEEIVDVKGWKALGNRLSQYKVTKVKPLEEPEDTSASADDDEATATDKGTDPDSNRGKKKSLTKSQLLKKTDKQPSSGSQRKSPKGRSSTVSPPKQKPQPKKSSKQTSSAKAKKKKR